MTSEIHALSGAYAVDALDDLERAQFERHLAECSECRAEVASLREAAAALAEDAAVAPPESLRAAVLSDITRVRPLPPETPQTPRPPTGETPAETVDPTDPVPPVTAPAAPARTRARRRWLPAVAAAAVFTVLGGSVAITQPWQDETSQQLSASERVLQAPDAEEVTLDFPDGSRATVTRSKTEGRAVITTAGMAAAPEGRVYELWLQHADGSMSPAGLMPPRADQTVVLEGDATEAVGAGITIEPAGGSQQPTSDPIALFDFSESA